MPPPPPPKAFFSCHLRQTFLSLYIIVISLTVQGLNLSRGKKFFLSPKCCDWLWVLPSPVSDWCCVSFLAVYHSVHEINHSPLSRAEAENEWSYTSTLATCPCGIYREKLYCFTLYVVVTYNLVFWDECLKVGAYCESVVTSLQNLILNVKRIQQPHHMLYGRLHRTAN
jgi:hypothetical protein